MLWGQVCRVVDTLDTAIGRPDSALLQDMRARWPGEHRAAAALQARLTDTVGGDADLRQLAADAFRGYGGHYPPTLPAKQHIMPWWRQPTCLLHSSGVSGLAASTSTEQR